jgi:hypothetical protein
MSRAYSFLDMLLLATMVSLVLAYME